MGLGFYLRTSDQIRETDERTMVPYTWYASLVYPSSLFLIAAFLSQAHFLGSRGKILFSKDRSSYQSRYVQPVATPVTLTFQCLFLHFIPDWHPPRED